MRVTVSFAAHPTPHSNTAQHDIDGGDVDGPLDARHFDVIAVEIGFNLVLRSPCRQRNSRGACWDAVRHGRWRDYRVGRSRDDISVNGQREGRGEMVMPGEVPPQLI
jgi:hypothetical protein